MNFREFAKNNQQTIVLIFGYLLVAGLGFGLSQLINKNQIGAKTVVQQAKSAPTNYTPNTSGTQTTLPIATDATVNCNGKIKGSSSHKYHLPSGAFYTKTTHPIACFDSEAQAIAAGFVKSAR